MRKYKNLKLNCSKGKLRKYRIGNFLMQEQQESRLATRRKKAQTKHKKTLYSRNSKKGERKRNRGKGNVSVFMLFCCLRKIFKVFPKSHLEARSQISTHLFSTMLLPCLQQISLFDLPYFYFFLNCFAVVFVFVLVFAFAVR